MTDGDDDLSRFLRGLDGRDGVPPAGRVALLRERLRAMASRDLKPGDQLRRVMDSEDVAEDALLDLVVALPSFRGSTWPEFLGFAEAILRRRVINHARHHHAAIRDVARQEPLPAAEPPHVATPTPSDAAARGESRQRIMTLVEGLPEVYRAVVRLRLDGQDYSAIAAALGIAEPAARQRMSRALDLLKERW